MTSCHADSARGWRHSGGTTSRSGGPRTDAVSWTVRLSVRRPRCPGEWWSRDGNRGDKGRGLCLGGNPRSCQQRLVEPGSVGFVVRAGAGATREDETVGVLERLPCVRLAGRVDAHLVGLDHELAGAARHPQLAARDVRPLRREVVDVVTADRALERRDVRDRDLVAVEEVLDDAAGVLETVAHTATGDGS